MQKRHQERFADFPCNSWSRCLPGNPIPRDSLAITSHLDTTLHTQSTSLRQTSRPEVKQLHSTLYAWGCKERQ